MKMKLRETDKTRMLKGFQSVGCLGSSLQPYAKAISIEPLLGKSSQTTAAISNIVSVKQPSQANHTVPIKPQVLIAMSGWCRISQPISVYSEKSWPSESLFNWKPRDSKQCCFAGLKRPAQHDNKSSTLKVKGILQKSCRQRGDREASSVLLCCRPAHLKPLCKVFIQSEIVSFLPSPSWIFLFLKQRL